MRPFTRPFTRPLIAALSTAVLVFTLAVVPGPALAAPGDPPRYDPNCPRQTGGPADAAAFPGWLAELKQWRTSERARIGYDPVNYDRPELAWARRNPIQPQVMVEDRFLFDPGTGAYTVTRFLDDLRARYGGIDSVLVWHHYPNIGVDNRNGKEMLLDLPGGVTGVRQLVRDFHAAGVKVLFAVNEWDSKTHDPGAAWSQIMPPLMRDVEADGINGDILGALPKAYLDNSIAAGRPLVLEPELGLFTAGDRANLGWNLQSWGYWCFPEAPMVSLPKWLEPRHTVHVNDRWSTSKIDMLQAAFFNGTGLESWENVWGIWNQLREIDGEAIRRVAAIERKFSDLLASQAWEPYTPTLLPKVYASKWPVGPYTMWTLVNRGTTDVTGPQLTVPHQTGMRYYDLWNGVELTPSVSGTQATLTFPIEGKGFGAVVSAAGAPSNDLLDFLTQMRQWAQRRLDSFSTARTVLKQAMTAIAPTQRYTSAPSGMVRIPGGQFPYNVRGMEVEGGAWQSGVGVQYPWETQPDRYHSRALAVPPFFIDRTPVTNAQFKLFLAATGYRPADTHNFLKDWNWSNPQSPEYPSGWDNRPVTWVSIEDARAWAAWAGRRLPHGWEWQIAAQGLDGRNYPWGDAWDAARVPPVFSGRGTMPPPDGVDAHPAGASPYGVLDMVGNVWQWTDEFADSHTRTAAVRGGSYYQPAGGVVWYFPSDKAAARLDHHNKYLLMSPGRDRAATIGFRTAADSDGAAPPYVSNGEFVTAYPPGPWVTWRGANWSGLEDRDAHGYGALGGTRGSETAQWAEYDFKGTGVDVYGWRGPGGGVVRILIDGQQVGQPVSERASADRYNYLLAGVRGLSNGTHTVRIERDNATQVGEKTMVDYLRVYTAVEAEQLVPPAEATAPYVVQNDCCGVQWSQGKQIWFQANGPGDKYTLTFNVAKTGKYDLALVYTKAWDFGIQTRTLDGTALGGPYDHWIQSGVALDRQVHPGVQLTAGQHRLTFTVTGKQPASPRYGFGLDAIMLDPAP